MLEPNHALKELEMRYAISSSVKAPLALRFKLEVVDSPVFVYFCPCL
ncbi:hypothetical protein CYJ67_01855 [Gardnerella vaginalis]|nr:hypothetical protein CYJ68_01900 [Gardnerella vaginalis]PKZ47513.1 hypothetical protein CYJ67_01855 [Gardnerella vaginalis]PNP86980.1 hypothetical protein BFS12_05775 [Gardnerella vaginalis]PZP00798.1 MAG: hypothetical protein DI615_00450 [Gardnerella vaginalis]PZP12057.1 MAG: hypothetical protein DI614_00450 [Gardnerella vaginalis]